jgi:hypothetical protein
MSFFAPLHQMIPMSTSLAGSWKSESGMSLFSLPLTEPRCDEISLDGNPKPVGMVRSKYTHAQKMRASMTHIFGRDFGLGKQDWTKNEQTGHMMGNPSTSHLLGTYMVSLRNRKVNNFPQAIFLLLLRILYTM